MNVAIEIEAIFRLAMTRYTKSGPPRKRDAAAENCAAVDPKQRRYYRGRMEQPYGGDELEF